MIINFKSTFLLVLFISFLSWYASAQTLDFANRVDVVLSDGLSVTLYGHTNSLSKDFTGRYSYLPAGLRLSKKADGTPMFLFSKFTTEDAEDDVSGALMHFLMEWGLTPEQEEELQTKLTSRIEGLSSTDPRFAAVENPRVMGAVDVRTDPDNSFEVISAVLSNGKETPTLVTSGRAPIIPGGKVAVAAMMEKNAAQLLAASFEESSSITDVSLALRFEYDLLMPAVDGRITVDWSSVDSVYQTYTRTANRSNDKKRDRKVSISDTERDSLFSQMQEQKAVVVQLDNLQPDSEVAKQMVTAFMEYFLRSVSEREFRPPGEEEDPDDKRNDQRGYDYRYRGYTVNRERLNIKKQRRKETYELSVRLPITRQFELVENLASWYDGVRDNEKCVNTVNLNDPTFEHREIQLILDLDAEDMFGKELNFVSVDIRKRRSAEGANDFQRQVTFDKRMFEEEGNRTTITYSKAEDENPDLFEYRTLYSLRGGRTFVPDTSWTQGSWQGLTLAPPVTPTPLRLEADLEAMKDNGIRNVSVQVRYYKFGVPTESNFNLNVSRQIGYLEDRIFMDRNTQGYAYRYVFFHEDHGPLATPWDAKINTGYLFAVIPEELRDRKQETIDEMVELGKAVAGGEQAGDVLDKFKDLIIKD
ncbi:hypothetical protein FUA23_07090 [Neolewinella aurantiaca]|uniref:Uncharacterized protein n=1 Tax=Neolewinella aurantiaca TaxID=2602767 RepID=A0A5C7FUL1_9BACT|nr:hypothetical protein [Neolewinella aurantiaca]TXF90277.1 hypothetical protein FUA23_07090 [Neolewinella aurantiaca]